MVPLDSLTPVFAELRSCSFLWVAVFGIFGKKYLVVDPRDDATQRMRNAVWVDLSNMLLWLITAGMGAFVFFKRRNTKTAPPMTLP